MTVDKTKYVLFAQIIVAIKTLQWMKENYAEKGTTEILITFPDVEGFDLEVPCDNTATLVTLIHAEN